VKGISHKIVDGGGIVRSIRNHGIRDLPHRFKAKYADKEGTRYYKKGRFISVYYDASPQTMKTVERELSMEEQILRNTHLKARSKLDTINTMNEKKNPYIQRVLAMEVQAAESVQE